MIRILSACGASLLLYMAAFIWLLDRPLSLGAMRARIDANLTAGAATSQPKLVILAGSNGPYSHRCETIAPLIGRPCINAGIAVGVGLDYLFLRWQAELHPGDIVYLPLEEAQYIRSRFANDLGPEAAIMLRHDHATLRAMSARRYLTALFVGDLRAAISSVIETTVAAVHRPGPLPDGGYNAWGDHVGHSAAMAAQNQSTLAAIKPFHPTGAEITAGYGTVLVVEFLRWAASHGIGVIGGLPTGFIDSPIRDDALAAIRMIYRDNGAGFIETPGHSRYQRSAFFDTQDHLNETVQITHSIAVAQALNQFMVRQPARLP
jgi:hypothetical protein